MQIHIRFYFILQIIRFSFEEFFQIPKAIVSPHYQYYYYFELQTLTIVNKLNHNPLKLIMINLCQLVQLNLVKFKLILILIILFSYSMSKAQATYFKLDFFSMSYYSRSNLMAFITFR